MTAMVLRSALLALAVALAATGAAGAAPAQSRRAKNGGKAATNAKASVPRGTAGPAYGARADVLQFALDVADRRGLDRGWIERSLAQARLLPAVQRLVMPPPPGTAKDWAAYRARFVEPSRIEAGARFWAANEPWLALAEERYGVPPQIVVGIVGVETFYGRIMGQYRVLDALATLAFDFPAGRSDRSDYFRAELEELFVLAQRAQVDPASLRGSFAGALGLPQFMPGSVNRHAVDFDGDGRIDLHASDADVIGSVARFLADHGWSRGMPTHFEVAAPVDTADRAALLAPDILPTFMPPEFAERGAALVAAGRSHDGPLALVELQNGTAAPSYVAGTRNFYVVTRYNRSSYYAMAVIALGAEVARAAGPRLEPRQSLRTTTLPIE
jgi:membrane-bound lytic murein transglycosylase B